MLETEWKSIITKQQYEDLESMFSWDWVKEQINHYYTDSTGELKKSGITLRVRTKDSKSVIQVKTHKNANSALQICEEKEFPTLDIPKLFTASDVNDMTGIEVEAACLGSLSTLRHSLFYTDGVEICLDKNEYLDTTDYEIEIEYTKEVPQELINKLSDVGVTFDTPSIGKCTRFMQRLFNIVHNG